MTQNELEMWWASLTIAQKERVARKGITNGAGKDADERQYRYPACSRWWVALSPEEQTLIHDHCVSRHGYLMQEWNDADPYGD